MWFFDSEVNSYEQAKFRTRDPKTDSGRNRRRKRQIRLGNGVACSSDQRYSRLKLSAVATRNEQSAREAAKGFGADRWFSDPFAMIRDDRIDVITIAVKVPAHRELVLAALEVGKAVYCEAPLGRTVAEAEEMASAVGPLHTAIGLQGRLNPAVRRAAQLVSSGKIGRPLNARIISSTTGFGPEMLSVHDYFNKESSGANLLTISAGHTLDVVEAILGTILEVDARTEIRWPVKLTDTDEESMR